MRKTISLIAVLGVGALALSACAGGGGGGTGGGTATQGKLAEGKTFTTAIPADPGSLDPTMTAQSVARGVGRNLYATLVAVTAKGDITTGLAEKWEATTTSASFTLREGLKCADGTDLTAATIADNINFVADPANKLGTTGLQIKPGMSAKADDAARTVSITSAAPDPFLIYNVGLAPIACGNALKDPKVLAKGGGATGMYQVEDIVPNGQYTLARNKHFIAGPKGFDPKAKGLPAKVVYKIVGNESTIANMLVAGELNAAMVNGPDRKRLDADTSLFRGKLLVPLGEFLTNQDKTRVLADPAVRKALFQGTDLAALRKIISGGDGSEMKSLVTIAPDPCRADSLSAVLPKFDATAAAAALDKAGWVAGSDGVRTKDGKKLAVTFMYTAGTGGTGTDTVELARDQWKKLGVEVTMKGVDPNGLQDALYKTRDWDLVMMTVAIQLPSQAIPFFSGPVPPNGLNFGSVEISEYQTAAAAASAKPGTEGCGDWTAAEQALVGNEAIVPFAQADRGPYGKKATFEITDGIDPTSIRMYE